MKKVILSIAFVLLFVAPVQAGLLNTVDMGDLVEIINASEPSLAWGYDFLSGDRVETVTVSLVTYSNRDLALGALRVGYSGEDMERPEAFVGALEIITPNIINRYVPERLKNWNANLKILKLIPSVSLVGGYSFADDPDADEDFVLAATAGPKITF